MDVNIQHKEEKPLLHRTDVRARIAYEGATPQRTQLRDKLAAELKTSAKNVIVRSINTEFGNQAVAVEASVYKDEQTLEQYEPNHMKKRHGVDEESKAKAEEARKAAEEAKKAEEAKAAEAKAAEAEQPEAKEEDA